MSGYLKLGDVPGESQDRGHKKWINILTIDESIRRPTRTPPRRRRRLRDIRITRPTPSKARPTLIKPPPVKPTPVKPPRIRIPRIGLPVLFGFRLGGFFPMLMQARISNQALEGRLEFTDPAGRILSSYVFRGGKITRLRVVPTPDARQAPDQVEIELVAEEWEPRQVPAATQAQ